MMLSFEEIKEQYGDNLHKFERGLLREYLQYQLLALIFSHPIGRKLSFLGGTCLRLVYKSRRFSEDLDFDNKGLSYEEFLKLAEYLKKELQGLGYIIEIKVVGKRSFRCYIKFPELLFKYGLSPLKREKIFVQLDTFNQGVDYKTELFILDKFDLFKQVIAAPKNVILSQKLWTITQRKRFKGRDFYDIMFLLQNTQPDIGFLKAKFGINDRRKLKKIILREIDGVQWNKVADDVRPFLINKEDSEKIKLFPKFLKQADF